MIDHLDHFVSEEAAKELDRLRAENQRLREENDSLRDTEKRLMEHIDAKTGDCVQDEMWDDMWHLVHPSDSSWEYPGQVIREVSHAFSELRADNQRLQSALESIVGRGTCKGPGAAVVVSMSTLVAIARQALEVSDE